jgi:hypothetical protein
MRETGSPGRDTVSPGPLRPRWRRLLAWPTGVLAGALLGGLLVAWQEEAGLFRDGDRPCWDSLSAAEVRELFGERDTAIAELTPVRSMRELTGACRLDAGRGGQLTFRVHRPLDSTLPVYPQQDLWARHFIRPEMDMLGADLVGMASATRAWVALPDTCESGGDEGNPLIVDLSGPDHEPPPEAGRTPEQNAQRRDLLVRTLIRVANGTMDLIGCTDPLPLPGALPALPALTTAENGSLCGSRHFALPKSQRDHARVQRLSDDERIRVCALGFNHLSLDLVFTTVTHPTLTAALQQLALGGTDRTGDGNSGWGRAENPLSAFYIPECGAGDAVFLVRDEYSYSESRLASALLPDWIAAESERLGCHPVDTGPR